MASKGDSSGWLKGHEGILFPSPQSGKERLRFFGARSFSVFLFRSLPGMDCGSFFDATVVAKYDGLCQKMGGLEDVVVL